ncbi:MAG: zinc-binding dehydrogenase [Acidobacteriota bacterium]|nr:MAG: zinc-binding dehydrogenase [Acidobacteriota bacterium]
MKAVVIREHGGVEKLLFEDAPRPECEPGGAVVRVKACALNHLDLWVRNGLTKRAFPFPLIPGCDVAGVVEEVGAGVDAWKPGAEVVIAPGLSCGSCAHCKAGDDNLCPSYAILGAWANGGCAEYVSVPAANLFLKPGRLSFEEAAAVPLVFLTAWQMLVTRARVRPDEDVLVHAAGSGVSSAAVQIAKLHGARVFVTAGSKEKIQKAKELGADEGVNYRTHDFTEEIMRLTDKRGVDVVVDHVGGEVFSKSLACLVKGGRIVTCGATSGYDISFNAALVFYKCVSVLGSTMGRRAHYFDILEHVEAGRLEPVVGRVLALEEVRRAHELLESREIFGKIVLRVSSP